MTSLENEENLLSVEYEHDNAIERQRAQEIKLKINGCKEIIVRQLPK